MTHVSWVNRSIFLATNTGTASFGIGTAVTGYMTPSSAGALDGEQYHYAAETTNGSGSVSAWEIGTGIYTATASTLARTALFSSSTNNTVNFATAPYVMLTAFAEDFETSLDADTNFYVSTTGSDSNNGLSSGQAWLTLQHAVDVVCGLELNGFIATINLADGTYVGCSMFVPNTSGFIRIKGNHATPSNVVITPNNVASRDCILIGANLTLLLNDFELQGESTPPYGAGLISSADYFIHVIMDNIIFNGNIQTCIYADTGSIWEVATFTASVANCNNIFEVDGGHVSIEDAITITGTPAWGHSFADVYNQGILHNPTNATITGSATGRRFVVGDGGVIQTGTNNLSYFPGDVAGDILQGGQYDSFGEGRHILTADTTFYVATTGSDVTGDGSSGNPWATPQFASDFIGQTIDFNGFSITVQLADGTYPGFLVGELYSSKGAFLTQYQAFCNATNPPIVFAGNAADHTLVVIDVYQVFKGFCVLVVPSPSVIVVFKNMTFISDNFTIQAGPIFITGVGANVCLGDGTGGTIGFSNPNIASGGECITAENFAFVALVDNFTLTGAWDYFCRADYNGMMWVLMGTMTFTAPCTTGGAFAQLGPNGQFNSMIFYSITPSGAPSGPKFSVNLNSLLMLDTTGVSDGLNLLPGTLPGIIATSGIVTYLDAGGNLQTLQANSGFNGIVANLPSVGIIPIGTRCFVTDALNPVDGSIVAGSGAVKVEVYSNGTNWIVAGAPSLSPTVTGNISTGYTVTPGNGGTLTTGGTFTATAVNGNYQYYTNNGAHTFANPSADCAIDVLVTNATNAGAITFSTFTVGTTGDALTTTLGNKFIISTRRINGTSTYLVKALQ